MMYNLPSSHYILVSDNTCGPKLQPESSYGILHPTPRAQYTAYTLLSSGAL